MISVLNHHIYEYQKGLRNLVLHTMSKKDVALAEKKLNDREISYLIWPIGSSRINVFFGNSKCIAIIRLFNKRHLNNLSNEEDFILGTMLGYDRIQQCDRYISRRSRDSRRFEAAMP